MSCPLPHVLVLLNLSRRSALLPGEASRRAVVLSSIALSACLPHAILFSSAACPPRLSTRWAGRFGDERRLLAIAMSMLMSSDAMRISLGCVFLGSLCSPSVHRPASRHGGRGGERRSRRCCFVRTSTACYSRWRRGLTCLLVPMSSVGFLLRCAIFVDRVRCGCRGCFPMVYCHCVVREDEHGIGSSGFLSLVFLTRFPLRLVINSSLVSTLIAATGIFNPFMPDCSWGRSFRRASPRPLYPWRTGRGVFMPIISAVSWLKRRGRMR